MSWVSASILSRGQQRAVALVGRVTAATVHVATGLVWRVGRHKVVTR